MDWTLPLGMPRPLVWEEGRFSGPVKSGKVGHDNHSYKELRHLKLD